MVKKAFVLGVVAISAIAGVGYIVMSDGSGSLQANSIDDMKPAAYLSGRSQKPHN